LQIELESQKLTYNLEAIKTVCVYGGANARTQLSSLAFASNDYSSNNALIVVATPGRLTDFVDRDLVALDNVDYLCLDEADRMLDMGFEPQIRKLVQKSNMKSKDNGRQTLMFSATFPGEIQKLASEFLRKSYVWIAVGKVGSTTTSIRQVLVESTSDKRRKLRLTVDALASQEGRTLIFVQKKRTATWLKKQLNKGGPEDGKPNERFTPIPALDIHGDRSQAQREAALAKFRSGETRVLVCVARL